MMLLQYIHSVLPSRLWLLCCSTCLLLGSLLTVSQAQITLDGSLGPRGALTGPNYAIPDSVGQIRGPNLFHSFGQFNLFRGESATFTGPNTIANIIGRVTGGSPSSIDGTIRSQIPGANLYVLNPSGVMFGPNASLDVSGSFHVSTADYLRLADGATFSAHLSETSTLSVAPPAAFGFLGPTPASVSIQGSTLQVSAGQTLSVIGGDIAIRDGVLIASGGRLNLASVAAAGEVGVNPTDSTAPLQVESFANLGRIDLAGARLDASGIRGGTVVIRGGRLLVDQSFIFADTQGAMDGVRIGVDINVAGEVAIANGSGITTDALGAGHAGDIRIRSGSLEASDAAFIASRPFPSTTGDGGDIVVEVGRLTFTRGAQIVTSTFSVGRSGSMTVTASDTLTLAGTSPDGRFPSGLFANAEGTGAGAGNAGSVVVKAPRVALTAGAQIDSLTFGPGQGGTVRVTATDAITIAGQDSFGNSSGLFANAVGSGDAGHVAVVTPTLAMDGGKIQALSSTSGNAGNITLEVGQLTLMGGAQIGSNSLGAGLGGTITITATDAVSLAANTQIDASGAGGGTVVIRSGRLLVDQSTIAANTLGEANGAGIGINLDVRESIVLTQNASITAASFGTGDAGDIRITAHSLRGTGNAFIGAGTFEDGSAGNIRIDVGTLTLTNRAVIDSSTFGDRAAGHVTVIAPTLELQGGRIRASTQGAGDAGSIAVEAGRVSLTEGGQIFSNTSSTGQGGTVTVTASEALRISGPNSGLFSNNTGSGNAGRVAIVTPVFEMVGGQIQAVSTRVGNGGTIEVHAGRVMLSGAAQLDSSARGTGRGGTVSVTATDTLTLAENAEIDVHGTGGGAVVIRGSTLLVDHASISADTVGNVDGARIGIDIAVAEAIRLTQGGAISTASRGAGKAGDMRITAGGVHMAGATIGAEAFGAGRAGDIVMNVGTLTLTAGAQISSTTTGTGPGGDVVVTATQGMTIAGAHSMDNPLDLAGLFAGTFGRGNAGRVAIATPMLTLEGFASISASTFNEGNAGAVEVTADRVVLAEGGSIFSNTRGPGQGGTVTITAREFLSIQAGGRVGISAFDRGNAGSVSIATPNLVMQGGFIETKAESTGGNAGTIVVDADRITLTEGAAIDSSTQGAG